MKNLRTIAVLILFFGALPAIASQQHPEHALALFSFGKDFDVGSVTAADAKASLTEDGQGLRIETGAAGRWPGITLKAPELKWDLSSRQYVAAEVKNIGKAAVRVYCRVDNPGADGAKNCVTENIYLEPGASGTLRIDLSPTPWRLSERVELVGMRAAPGYPETLDPRNVAQMLFFVSEPKTDHAFEVRNIHAGGRATVLDAATFFPFIDEFGQFIHAEWPGKTRSLDDLSAHLKAEQEDISEHSAPNDWDKFGGWTAGPKLRATGFFRVEKLKNKWWLVDPDGRLFWSHGIDCVGMGNITPITDREHYFRNLPESGSPFEQFYGRGSWAPHGYYKDHAPYKTYDFGKVNLTRKYGGQWEQRHAEMAHRRLKSWGMNTIANWSDSRIYLMRRTPYVSTISFNARTIEGSTGYWGKFYDVFDPSFRQSLVKRLDAERGVSAGDPWCVGYFVHNELSWGDETSLAEATLRSPPDQPAKTAFINDLKAKYKTIDKLNEAWGTGHGSWADLQQSQEAPDKQKARNDLTVFYTKVAETYFRTIRDELKKVAPNQIYLGCRFAWVNDRAVRAAAKFCDVISFNRYSYSVEQERLPEGIDLPTIIGEFHFGALDRGMFHTGLRKTISQEDRADKYSAYVMGALRNRHIVGTHWFQYKDQATTGRGDGENYQIGFLDVCDTPYAETVRACRSVGWGMYEYRFKTE